MTKAEKQAARYTGYCRNKAYEDFLNGYHQAVADACEWLGSGRIWQYIAHDKEADTIYMTGNLYEDLKQAMEE